MHEISLSDYPIQQEIVSHLFITSKESKRKSQNKHDPSPPDFKMKNPNEIICSSFMTNKR